jgi:hypothetical protein
MWAATVKQSTTRADVKGETAKTAKLEADKKKRKRKESPPPAVSTPKIPTPATRDVEEVEDEATNDPPFFEDRTERRSPSPAAKRQWDLEQQMTADDLHRMTLAQQAAAGTPAKMPMKIKVQPLRLKPRALATVR